MWCRHSRAGLLIRCRHGGDEAIDFVPGSALGHGHQDVIVRTAEWPQIRTDIEARLFGSRDELVRSVTTLDRELLKERLIECHFDAVDLAQFLRRVVSFAASQVGKTG